MAYTTIDKPEDYFNTVLYTANNGTLNVTGVGFQPDWVWIKGRSYTAHSNMYDVVRGVQKDLLSGSTNAETSSGELTSFNSDGFTVVDSATDRANYLTNTHVAWNWLAGGTASSNTDGSITSSVSANTTAGFSIVSYTGSGTISDTVGHGLGTTPNVVIIKNRDTGTSGWNVHHSGLSSGYNLQLQSTGAQFNSSGQGHIGTVGSSTFGFVAGSSGNDQVNDNTEKYIAYCFAEKKGYSKFGSYVASGDATDANFIYLGFKPSWVMFKKTSGADNWLILDNKRSSSSGKNLVDFHLRANLNNAESDLSGSDNGVDFLSNGIKLRKNNGEFNASGGTYIYMAFAESPFVTSTGIPTTAR